MTLPWNALTELDKQARLDNQRDYLERMAGETSAPEVYRHRYFIESFIYLGDAIRQLSDSIRWAALKTQDRP